MKKEARKVRKAEKKRAKELRKDRLIQTRVDRRLQTALQDEARRRRMSVSNLVRNVLEDAFGLAPEDAGPALDEDSVRVAPSATLDHVIAWNAVVLGRPTQCSMCDREMEAGQRALLGVSDDPDAERAWLCVECSPG